MAVKEALINKMRFAGYAAIYSSKCWTVLNTIKLKNEPNFGKLFEFT